RSTSPPTSAWGAPPRAHPVRGPSRVPSGLALLVVVLVLTLEDAGGGTPALRLGLRASPAGALGVAQRLLEDALVGHRGLVHGGVLRVVQVEGRPLGADAGQRGEVVPRGRAAGGPLEGVREAPRV